MVVSPRWRKVLRDLWINKTRTLLVVLSIAVGVFAVGMIGGSRIILSKGLNESYAAVHPADATFITEPFDDSLLESLSTVPQVKAVEGRRTMVVRVLVGPEQRKDLLLTVFRDYRDIRVNQITPTSGAWPPPEHELLIERASMEFLQVQEGETLTIETADGRQRQMRVAGQVHDLTQPQATLVNQGFGYVTFDTLEWLGGPRSYDQLFILVEGTRDKAEIQRVANQVRDKVEKSGHAVLVIFVPEPGQHPADTALQPMLLLLSGLGGLALVLSGFLVVNIISALLTQQTRQIGMMKAIGAQTGQIMWMYFGAVFIFGLLALLIAVPLGGLGAHGFSSFIAHFMNVDIQNFTIPTSVLLTEIAVGIMVPMVAALWPILSGTRVTVHEAINAYGLGKGHFGVGLIDRLIGQIRGLPRPMLLSLRNTFRRKGRLLLTLLTLTLSSAIFVVVFTLRASLLLTLDDALSFWNYDIAVVFSRPYRMEVIQQEALALEGIASAEGWAFAGVRRQRPDGTESDNISAYGLTATTKLLRPTIVEGRWLLPEDESAVVINTDMVRNEPDIRLGDEILLKIAGRESAWRVVGIVRGVLTGPALFANEHYFSRVTGGVGRAAQMLAVTEERDPATQEQLAAALKARYEAAGLQVAQTLTIETARQQIEFFFNIIVAFLAIMVVLLGVVGGLGLMGTMSINVIERTREIGVMRAIGASDGAVFRIFLVEGILISVMSWAAGTLLALPLSKLLSDAVGEALLRAPLSYSFSWMGALIWLGIVIVLAGLASFLPARSAARLSVREVLAYE